MTQGISQYTITFAVVLIAENPLQLGNLYSSMRPLTNACNIARVSAAMQRYEREPWMANWQLNMDVVRQRLLLKKRQEEIAVDPLSVDSLLKNQGVKPHDFDFAFTSLHPIRYSNQLINPKSQR